MEGQMTPEDDADPADGDKEGVGLHPEGGTGRRRKSPTIVGHKGCGVSSPGF